MIIMLKIVFILFNKLNYAGRVQNEKIVHWNRR